MIIVSADTAAEAADLHDLLRHHLVWEHRVYVRGVEYTPPNPVPVPPHHELLRQILRDADGPLPLRALTVLLHRGSVHVEREAVHRWLQADIAAGLVRAVGREEPGSPFWRYAWAADMPLASAARELMREILRAYGPMTIAQLVAGLNARGHARARETVQRWLAADAAAGLARPVSTERGRPWTYAWAGGPS